MTSYVRKRVKKNSFLSLYHIYYGNYTMCWNFSWRLATLPGGDFKKPKSRKSTGFATAVAPTATNPKVLSFMIGLFFFSISLSSVSKMIWNISLTKSIAQYFCIRAGTISGSFWLPWIVEWRANQTTNVFYLRVTSFRVYNRTTFVQIV